MSIDWRNWCRLCGNCESTMKIEYTSELEQIILIFMSIPTSDLRVCNNCLYTLNEIQCLIEKSKSIQNMFAELLNLDKDTATIDILNETRMRFGLKELDIEDQMIKTSPAKSESIKEEQLEDPTSRVEIPFLGADLSVPEDDYSDNESREAQNEGLFNVVECELTDGKISESGRSNRDSSDDEDEDEDEDDEEEEEEEEQYKEEKKRKKKKRSYSSERQDYVKTQEEKLFDFICHICKIEFPKMCFLSKHCRTEHNCLPQVNCMCGKTLGTWNRLLIHKRKHFPEKSHYECQQCGLTYLKQSTYESHMNTKHGPGAEKFVCSQCGRCVKDARTLKKHERTHLPDELKLTELCTICNKRFVNKNSLQSHISSVHTKENIFTCEQCGKCFNSKGNLRSHLTSHITEKTVPCDKCDMKFKCAASLRTHRKIHNENIYECKICGNKYRTRQYLIGHMVVHSDEKKYKCTYCPNEYKRSKDLKCHMNLHTGERPYSCLFCDRTFVNGSNCRKHKLKDHPIELAAYEALHGKGKAGLYPNSS